MSGQRFEDGLAGGLYFYRARWYDPALGRFLQPDTIVPEQGNPQSLNRYTYVNNRPTVYTDPTGHRADPGGADIVSCTTTRDYVGNCTYPVGHEFQGYPIGTTQVDIDQANAQLKTVGEVIGGILWEPADWVFTFNHWRQGDFHILDLAGLLPLVPASGVRALRYSDEVVSLMHALPNPRYSNPWQGKIVSTVLDQDTVMYRVWGGNDPRGKWLAPIRPATQGEARSLLALPDSNTAEYVSEVLVPAGTRFQIGAAGPNFGRSGGALQVELMEEIPDSAFGPGMPLPMGFLPSP